MSNTPNSTRLGARGSTPRGWSVKKSTPSIGREASSSAMGAIACSNQHVLLGLHPPPEGRSTIFGGATSSHSSSTSPACSIQETAVYTPGIPLRTPEGPDTPTRISNAIHAKHRRNFPQPACQDEGSDDDCWYDFSTMDRDFPKRVITSLPGTVATADANMESPDPLPSDHRQHGRSGHCVVQADEVLHHARVAEICHQQARMEGQSSDEHDDEHHQGCQLQPYVQ